MFVHQVSAIERTFQNTAILLSYISFPSYFDMTSLSTPECCILNYSQLGCYQRNVFFLSCVYEFFLFVLRLICILQLINFL